MRLTFRSGHRPPSVQQTRHKLLREALHEVLWAAVHAAAANGIGSVPSRAVAALYQVLLNHPIDRRGRCRSCRRPGALFGRRYRRCRVYFDVDFWLHQPDTGVLLGQLRTELRQQRPESSSRTPAVPPPPFLPGGSSRAGRPDPDHGGGGEPCPEGPRPAVAQSDEQPPPEPGLRRFESASAAALH